MSEQTTAIAIGSGDTCTECQVEATIEVNLAKRTISQVFTGSDGTRLEVPLTLDQTAALAQSLTIAILRLERHRLCGPERNSD